MTWLARLYESYEQAMLLPIPDEEKPIPVFHTIQTAHINVVIDGDGNFIDAQVMKKPVIVLPATESSAGRASGEAAHALADKLQYVAGDYKQFGGKKRAYFEGYLHQLTQWCESDYSHPHIKAIKAYVEKSCLMQDLVDKKVAHIDTNNQLLTSWPDDNDSSTRELFQVLPKEKGELDQGNALVCWSVNIPGEANNHTWTNTEIQQCWIDHCNQADGNIGLCLVTGNEHSLASNHPAKLRHSGDKAKLISSNDLSGFTFRGRFTDTKASIKQHGMQAANVGNTTTQKAHNALRWLISRQRHRSGDQVVVAWAVSGKDIPEPLPDDVLFDLDDIDEITEPAITSSADFTPDHSTDLGQSYARNLSQYISGYGFKPEDNDSVVIMSIDSATPGRMAVTYYREFQAYEYVKHVERWHIDFAWSQRYRSKTGGDSFPSKVTRRVFAPPPKAIFAAAYGNANKSNERLRFTLNERLMPCIVDGCNIPYDLVALCANRASNPLPLEEWEWERNLGTACALYRGFFSRHPNENQRRTYSMALEEDNCSRDYLYGRLLALAETIEARALYMAGENRPTTAKRLMQRFHQHPYSTWLNIELALGPYQQRIQRQRQGLDRAYNSYLDNIMSTFNDSNEFKSDVKLTPEYLLGYHCQRQWFNERYVEKGQWLLKTEKTDTQTTTETEGATL